MKNKKIRICEECNTPLTKDNDMIEITDRDICRSCFNKTVEGIMASLDNLLDRLT